MITEKQLRIFEVFARKPFAEYMRKDVKKDSGEKSNNLMALTINSLKKEKILIEKKFGKTGVLKLNLDNDLTFSYIALCNENRISNLVKRSLKIVKEDIVGYTPFFSLVVFGSYAVGQEKKDSDLDVAVFIENESDRKKIEMYSNSAKLKSILEMDIQVIPKAEMIEMLTNDEENLGKQIARKHIAVYNHRIFYELVKEGMKRGFRL